MRLRSVQVQGTEEAEGRKEGKRMPDNNNARAFPRHPSHPSTKIKPVNGSNSKQGKKVPAAQAQATWLRRMVWEVNKFPYSNSKNVSLYLFNPAELDWYYKEILRLADTVLDILECPHCGNTIVKVLICDL